MFKGESMFIYYVSWGLTRAVEVYLHLLLTSQWIEVSGDTHALPSFSNRVCGTN